jgi:integrase
VALTNTSAKNAKPKDKPYKLSDAGGLYLYVHPSGSKTWRLKYRLEGKERTLTIGKYSPSTEFGYSLAKARTVRDQAKDLLSKGVDPSQDKQRKKLETKIKQSDTFKLIAIEWWNTKKSSWSENHADAVLHTLKQNIFPCLGHRPITDISPPELLQTIRKIESRGALEMAAKVLQRCNAIYRFAITTGRANYNPATDLREALKTPERRNHPALSAKELPEFLRKLSAYDGHIQTRLATELLILTFVRSGELRGAKWDEIDWDQMEWRIPKERMKMREEHIVPLSSQAISILDQLKGLSGHHGYVFPSQQNANKPMSENTILYALYRLGYHSRATAHGFRQTASTILNETGFTPDAIERQLAHAERNKIRAAYNKAEYLPERRKMMQWWGDYLDQIESGSNVIAATFGKVD